MSRNENLLIKKFVQDLKRDLQTINQHNYALIFTGLTGSGKGTLIHYLIKNHRLFSQMSETGDMIIKLKKKNESLLDNISISNKMASDTSMPYQIQYKGQIYRDLPGFMDNRDDEKYIPQDIINSFFIHQVYRKTKNIKFIFTSSKNSLTDRASQFIKSLNHFAQRFQDIQHIKKSVFLVVTKVPSHLELKHINFILSSILKDLRNEIPQKTKILLDFWVEYQDNVQLFKVPEKQGPLNFKNSDLILQKIKRIPYSQSPQIKNVISEYSQSRMIQLEEKWNLAISEICFQIVQANYEEYLRKIQKIKMLNTAKSNLNYLRHKLDQLMGADSPEQFRKRLKNIPQLYKGKQQSKSSQLMKQFDQYFQFLLLFSKIQPAILNILKWKEPLYKVNHNISQLVSEPWEQIHGQDVYIKGFVIESAVIQKKINLHKSNHRLIKGKIVIFAYFLIMNQDIEAQGTNMMIYSQYFLVQDNIAKIRLNGQNAKDYLAFIDDDNKNGLPGKPGFNAGNLLLKVYQKSQNLGQFSVDLRGGRGGRGKDGGIIKTKQIKSYYIHQIKNDVTMPTNKKKYLSFRQDYKFSERNIFSKVGEILRILGTYNGQVVEFYSTQVHIDENLQRFKHTLGGIGGKPGYSGSFHVSMGDQVVIVLDKPQQSLNGQGHVEVYEGLYVKQMIFSNFRDEGQQLNIKKLREQENLKNEFQRVQQQMAQRRQKKLQRMNRSISAQSKISQSIDQNQLQERFGLNSNELKQMVNQTKQELEDQQQLKTPVRYKTKYKQETEYIEEDSIIREEQNQQDEGQKIQNPKKQFEVRNNLQASRKINIPQSATKIKFNEKPYYGFNQQDKKQQLMNKEPYIKRKIINSISKNYYSANKITVPSQTQKNSKTSNLTISTSKKSLKDSTFDRFSRKKLNRLVDSRSSITQQNIQTQKQLIPIEPSKIINELGNQVATDIGTGAVQKFAQRLINKVCQKIVRSGITMEKQVLRQFVQNSVKNQAEKKLLAELGILTGQSFSRQIAKAALKMEQNIITNLGKQIIRDTSSLLQRQAFKHLSQDLAKQGLKRFGKEAARQAQIQIAAKSLSSSTAYVQGMLSGLGKSIIFQIFLSALMASGITDGWLIKPHFKSKKISLKDHNYQGLTQPEPYFDFTEEQLIDTEHEYQAFVSSFKQFKSVFADKI